MTRSLMLIAWTVWLEFIRRKDFYVVFMLGLLFSMGVAVTRIIGIDSAATANFLMSFGLSLSYLLAAVLAVSLGSRQLPAEIEKRTLQPLLARPISRALVLIGKVGAVTALASLTLVALTAISYLPAPKSEEQSLFVLGQVVFLQVVSLGVLTALVTGLSLYVPAVVAALIALVTFFAGGMVVNFAGRIGGRTLGVIGKPIEHLAALIPDFSVFNHVQRFVDGGAAIGATQFLSITAYGAVFFSFVYLISAFAFNRKTI